MRKTVSASASILMGVHALAPLNSNFFCRRAAGLERDVHVADHKTADQLMGWLKQNGFEARHEDDHDH